MQVGIIYYCFASHLLRQVSVCVLTYSFSFFRNEVWRYDPKFYGNEYRNALKSLGRGLKYAVGAMVITIAVESFMKKKKNGTAHESDSENGHH